MFGFILVGLSLVSMVINLLQAKVRILDFGFFSTIPNDIFQMKSTYEAGRNEDKSVVHHAHHHALPTSLGVMRCYSVDEEKKADVSERSLSRSTQTSLSLPGVRQVRASYWVCLEGEQFLRC